MSDKYRINFAVVSFGNIDELLMHQLDGIVDPITNIKMDLLSSGNLSEIKASSNDYISEGYGNQVLDYIKEVNQDSSSSIDQSRIGLLIKNGNVNLFELATIATGIATEAQFSDALSRISKDITTLLFVKSNINVKLFSKFWMIEDDSNLGICAKCGTWTTDYTKPHYQSAMWEGAQVNGIWFCEFDLPPDHPQAVRLPGPLASKYISLR